MTHPAKAHAWLRSGEFFAPLPLFAVLLMFVNDRWLKAEFHNAITGKLSDLAICFFLPLFVSEMLGLLLGLRPRVRLPIGGAVTVVVFVAIEVVTPVTELALSALQVLGPLVGVAGPFVMTRDLTDLACVALVPIALLYGARRLTQREVALLSRSDTPEIQSA